MMELYSKEGILLLVQIDHLNGEILGGVIDSFYESGAKNVQIINSITKKNRPAYIMLIDTNLEHVEQLEALVINECGASGWHRINTCHRHTNVSVISKQIKIVTKQSVYDFTAEGKVIADDLKNVRPEHDNCIKLKNLLIENEATHIPLKQLSTALMGVFHENKEELIITGGKL